MDNNTVYVWILQTTFMTSARTKSLRQMEPYLASLVQPDTEVLDLCCGSGFASFWFEEQGARVTGMDFAPYMISLAREETFCRNSRAEFVEADIFSHDFGRECFDLISCFDSISDFPLSDFAKLKKKAAQALKPGGQFIVKYADGCHKFMQEKVERAGVYQEAPERITFRYKEYLSEIRASVNIIRNETHGEEYERKGYIYTAPVVHLAISSVFDLERCVTLSKNESLDIFIKLR